MLNMVTIRNLIRPAEISCWSFRINMYDQVVWWFIVYSVIISQESTNTALRKEDIRTQRPKFNRLKTRNNLRTTGFNLFEGKRSIHSTLSTRKGIQASVLLFCYRRSFSKKVLATNLNKRALITDIKQQIKKCKNKDGRYGNIIQIIGSSSTLILAYLIIKNNSKVSIKRVDNVVLFDEINYDFIRKLSSDILSGSLLLKPIIQVTTLKQDVFGFYEKILQKAIEIVLVIIYETVFLDCSHGFRPGRSVYTALKDLQLNINSNTKYSWVIDSDVSTFVENLSHEIILKCLRQKVDCPATNSLIKKLLNAGYLLNTKLKSRNANVQLYNSCFNIFDNNVSNLLFGNIILHELDNFVEEKLNIVTNINSIQISNAENDCKHIYHETCKKRQKILANKDLKKLKKIFYVRYNDNWVILFSGSFTDAVHVRNMMLNELKKLGFIINKIQILSLLKDKCRFLGVDFFYHKKIQKDLNSIKRISKRNLTLNQRVISSIILHAPILELLILLKNKGFVKRNHNGNFFPQGKTNCIYLTHSQILKYYNKIIKNILLYYKCVHNRNQLQSIIRYLHYSCALTLARKFKLRTLRKTFKKFGKSLECANSNGEKNSLYEAF